MSSKSRFDIIRYRGDPQKTTTLKGQPVERKTSLFIPEWNVDIKCAPYDNHFIYENPDKGIGSTAYLCTCGGAGVVVPPDLSGMFVCLTHATYGFHSTSFINKKDFANIAGGIVKPKGKKWE